MKKISIVSGLFAIIFLVSGCTSASQTSQTNQTGTSDQTSQITETTSVPATSAADSVVAPVSKIAGNDLLKTYSQAIFHTSEGNFTIQFYNSQAPITVNNFLSLAKSGFYSGTRFHRVVKGFMIQGGDPLSKDLSRQDQWGTGGSEPIADEFISDLLNNRGTIAMAHTSAPNSASSQFFINTKDNAFLNGQYAVFGKVISGMDVIDKIENGEVKENNSGEASQPLKPVTIKSIDLIK
jgi:peptidyl-prolyl cis-trans isomerase B (cyclophilin B)